MGNSRLLLNLINIDITKKISCGSGILLGSVLLVNNQNKDEKKTWSPENFAKVKADNVNVSRKINSEFDQTGLNLRLYQYQTCPYCCKVRAFLDYYGFSYEIVEVNPITKSQIKFSKDYKKVPILNSSCCKPMVESSLIISVLSTFLKQKDATLNETVELYPAVKDVNDVNKEITTYPNKYVVMLENNKSIKSQQQLQNIREEREWREWVDEHFIHLISPNVYRTWDEALETFYYFDKVGEWKKNFPLWERYLAIYLGAAAMFQISKRLKKKHNIDDERRAMHNAFQKFLDAKGERKFLGGEKPNLADLALFGAINSFEGCKAFTEMCEQTKIGIWFDDMQAVVQQRKGCSELIEKCKTQ